MKMQIVNAPADQLFRNEHGPRTAKQLWQVPLAVALVMSALLLTANIAAQAQNPPNTYNAQSDGIFGFPPGPATIANGSSGAWTFSADLPAAYEYNSRILGEGCGNCIQEAFWSYDYYPGGSFTLGDGTDTFNGIFTSGYGSGYAIEQLLSSDLGLDMYFTGQWNTGLKQAGFMYLYETQNTGIIIGTARLSFGPAPEPGSIMLFGSGILGIAGVLRRRLMG